MDYTQAIGNVNELQCISKFIEMGFQCSIPYGNAALYDFIADINGELIRVQCKSSIYSKRSSDGRIDYNAFIINCTRSTTNTKKTVRYTYNEKDVDYFATYFNNQVYLIPVVECSTSKTLRFAPPNNGQLNYNKAEDYTIENILGHLQNELFVQKQVEHKKQISENTKEPILCKQCHKNYVSKKDGICIECAHLNSRMVERPDRKKLKEMIRTMSFVSIGKYFDITDNAVRKWCIAENLPSKKGDINSYSDEEWDKI